MQRKLTEPADKIRAAHVSDPMDGHLSVVGRTTTRLGGSQEPPDSTGTRPGGIG